jgi:hypothetical protein
MMSFTRACRAEESERDAEELEWKSCDCDDTSPVGAADDEAIVNESATGGEGEH